MNDPINGSHDSHGTNGNGNGNGKLPSLFSAGNNVHLPMSYSPMPSAMFQGQSAHSPTQGALSVAFLLHVLRKRWRASVALGAVLATIAAGTVWYFHKPQYTSEAILQILSHRPSIVQPLIEERETSKTFVNNQVQLIRSPVVLRKVVARPEIAKLPETANEQDLVSWLSNRLTVTSFNNSELFRIRVTASSQPVATLLVDAIHQEFFAVHTFESKDRAQKILSALSAEKNHQHEEIRQLEDRLRTLVQTQSKTNNTVLKSTGESVVDVGPILSGLQSQLTNTEIDRRLAEAEAKAESAGAPTEANVSAAKISLAVSQHPEILLMEQDLTKLQSEAELSKEGTKTRDRAEEKIKKLEAKIEDRREAIRSSLIKIELEQLAAEHDSKKNDAKQRAEMLKEKETNLRQRVQEEIDKLQSQTGSNLEIEFLRFSLQQAKEVAGRIDERIFTLGVEMDAPERPDQITLMQSAMPVVNQGKLMLFVQLGMAGLAGLVLPFFIFAAIEFISRRVYAPQQVEQIVQLPLVGEIASIPARPVIPRIGAKRKYQRDRLVFEESVESLRSAMAVSDRMKDLQVIVICSAVSGEGKTSLVSQLAVSWARGATDPVLVIDADTRNPNLHELFDIDNEPGLVDVLEGKAELASVIRDWGNQVHVIPAGALESSPHRLFSGSAFSAFIAELRQKYRRIIIDVPPVLAAGESLQIAKEADGVLMCAMRDHSKADQMRLAYNKLQMAGVRCMGIVLNGTSVSSYTYRYGAYYG